MACLNTRTYSIRFPHKPGGTWYRILRVQAHPLMEQHHTVSASALGWSNDPTHQRTQPTCATAKMARTVQHVCVSPRPTSRTSASSLERALPMLFRPRCPSPVENTHDCCRHTHTSHTQQEMLNYHASLTALEPSNNFGRTIGLSTTPQSQR